MSSDWEICKECLENQQVGKICSYHSVAEQLECPKIKENHKCQSDKSSAQTKPGNQ
jgi:hypothetical protein